MDYDKFLEEAQKVYENTKKNKLYDRSGKEINRVCLFEGLSFGRKIDDKNFIVVKIGVGTQEELRNIFHESE